MKSLWRIDTLLQTVEFAENVDDKAPVGAWLMPPVGDGYYRYEETEELAREILSMQLGLNAKRAAANTSRAMVDPGNLDNTFTFEDFLIWEFIKRRQAVPRWSFTDAEYKEKFKRMAEEQYILALKDEKLAVELVNSY